MVRFLKLSGIAGLSVLIVFSALSSLSYANNSQCSDVSLIFLRGSGQNPKSEFIDKPLSADFKKQEQQSYSFFNELDKKINNKTKEFVSFHNQGGHKYGYKAQGIESFTKKAEHNTETTVRNNAYYESMYDGSDALTQYLKKKISSCPTQQIILGGYSQGAQVVGESIPRLTTQERSNIKFVALYGDPKLNTKDNSSVWKKGPWVRGNTNRNINGVLGARVQYLPEDMRQKSGSWCDIGDPVCAGRSVNTNIFSKSLFDKFGDKTHSDVYQKSWIEASSSEIASKIEPDKFANKKPYLEQTLYFKEGTRPLTDIVLIVDNSGFMSSEMEYIRNNKTQIAESFLKDKPNTQVSIVRYGNQSIPFYSPSRVYADQFRMPTNSVNTLAEGLGNLHPLPNGDSKTAILDGLEAATKLEEKTGRAGAQKHFIAITKNKPLPFDHLVVYEQITSSVIYERMKELDPAIANIMILPDSSGNYSALPELQSIARATNGQVVQASLSNMQSSFNEFSTILDSSPVAVISNVEYEGNKVYMTGGDSYDPNSYITSYKWDCNDDGIWDIEDTQASATCEYQADYDGLVVLEVETFDGQSAKAIQSLSVRPVVELEISLEPPLVEVNYSGDVSLSVINQYDPGTYFEVYDEQEDLLLENVSSPIVHDSFLVNGSKFYVKAVNGARESALVEVKVSTQVPEEPDSTPANTVTKADPINNETTAVLNGNNSPIYEFGNILGVKLPDVVATQNTAGDSFSGDNNSTNVNSNNGTQFSVVGSGEGNHTQKNKPEQMSSSTKVLGENNKKEGLFGFRNLLYLAAFLGLVFITLYIIRKSNETTEEL